MNRQHSGNTPSMEEKTGSPVSAADPTMVNSETLLGEQGLVLILHQGERYQLRQTKTGKLILTK